MKSIDEILKDAGLTLTEEQQAAVSKEVNENYKTIDEYTEQAGTLEALRAVKHFCPRCWKQKQNGRR